MNKANLDIQVFRAYYESDEVFITNHAAERCRQRGITTRDLRSVIFSGEIIEFYPDDYPFPSYLICGKDASERIIHVCMSNEGTGSKIITAYLPSLERWSSDFKSRKEVNK